MKKKEILIITGAGKGIGAYLAKNFSNDFFIILISKSNNCRIVSNEINKIKPFSSDFILIDLEKEINFDLFENKIKWKEFINIHLIFCAGYLENYSNELNLSEWKKVFAINFFSHVRTVENLSLRYSKYNFSIFAIAPGAIQTDMLSKVLKKTSVGTRTSKEELFKFLEYVFKNESNYLNGKLVHIRDNLQKLEENKNKNYLKLRRIE